ncbi:ISSpo8, transposase [Caenispirillum salinarum AK4]|uniref:ISSpo8, transposase n=1 Tax=Caenispirillum salinarum AK4 TaxID=1238182 RepID=K9GN26_9PROT|nr:IS1595 family transposase [Caenispirillum salinarum]EKV27385.1 ISSpo8, transposase [Caenispirillum salinarum AK4]
MSLLDFIGEVPDEDVAERWLIKQRWPSGMTCPTCGSSHVRRLRGRRLFQCRCRRQFSVTSGSAMHGTRLPLRAWAVGIFLFVTSSKGISARKMSAWLGISYKAAWFMGHRIRAMMAAWRPLSGIVEIDEAYYGTRRRKPGRGAGPALVMVAVERSGDAVARAIQSHGRVYIADALKGVLSKDSVIMTDGLPAYRCLGGRSVRHSAGEFVRGEVHVNTAEGFNGLFKRAVTGVYHWISVKHADRYAAEAAFRWSERRLCSGTPMPYGTLVG